MIALIREYTTQTVFVSLQATCIVYGIAVTSTFLNAYGYPEFDLFNWLPKFVRHAGLAFFLIPALWVWAAITHEQSDRRFPKEVTVGPGIVVILFLWKVFSVSAQRSLVGTI